MMRSSIALLFCLLVSSASISTAQQNISAATLGGVVEDVNGSVIGGATVTIVNLATNQSQNAVSDVAGRFRFNYVPVGTYDLSAKKDGFDEIDQKITTTLGQALEIKAVLRKMPQ